MLSDYRFYLPKALKAQQMGVLSSRVGLCQLFDKIQADIAFTVPENSVVINLDNITFGPNRYTIISAQSDHHFFKVIYYCLLYYIFERAYDDHSRKAYEKLLSYILTQPIETHHLPTTITPQDAKVYLTKFLQILASAKNTHKIVLEELNSLPQIDIIFLELIKQISGFRQLKFEQNARAIENNLFEKLGVRFDLLSCQLFLVGDEFQVDMRHFQKSCEFSLYKDTHQNITKIKAEFYMGQSAYFKEKEEESHLCGNLENQLKRKSRKVKVAKKSTIKSIQWNGDNQSNGDSSAKCDDLDINNESMLIVEPKKARKNSDIGTNVESQGMSQKPKPYHFYQIMGSSDSMVSSTTQSINVNPPHAALKGLDLRKRFHKFSLQTCEQLMPFERCGGLGLSYSVKCIKTDGFDEIRTKQRVSKRVPTFILNRMKAKEQNKQNPQGAKSVPKLINNNSTKHLRINFTYRQ